MPLHPEKYARHVLRDLRLFLEGKIDYPDIDLRLAGEEAWTDAFPELRDAIHRIIETIHEFAREYDLDAGGRLDFEAEMELINEIKPDLKIVEKFAMGDAREEKEYEEELEEAEGCC